MPAIGAPIFFRQHVRVWVACPPRHLVTRPANLPICLDLIHIISASVAPGCSQTMCYEREGSAGQASALVVTI